ncbi:MAG: IclR family transcriptional regulator [Haloarculaceae archaeon]
MVRIKHRDERVTLAHVQRDFDGVLLAFGERLVGFVEIFEVELVGEQRVDIDLSVLDYVRDRKQIYQLAKPKITELAEKTEERAEFMVEEYGRSVFVHRDTGDNAVQTDSGIGKFHPLHATAAGKSILAFLPEERVDEICETRGLESFTDNTITDKETLFAELETIRERGVGYNDQEYINGLRAVGVPVKDVDESIVGAISVSGPTHRLKGEWYEEEIPDLLLGMTNEIELKISYPEDGS